MKPFLKRAWELFLTMITAIWNFFKVIHSGSDEASAKRVYGGLIIIAILVILYLASMEVVPEKIWISIQSTVEYVFTVGASLLGLNTLIDVYKVAKNGKDKGAAPNP